MRRIYVEVRHIDEGGYYNGVSTKLKYGLGGYLSGSKNGKDNGKYGLGKEGRKVVKEGLEKKVNLKNEDGVEKEIEAEKRMKELVLLY